MLPVDHIKSSRSPVYDHVKGKQNYLRYWRCIRKINTSFVYCFLGDLNRFCDLPQQATTFVGKNSSNRPELKRYRQYTRHDIAAAIEAVRSGQSALQASRLYGVPSRTLYDKVKKLGIVTGRPYRQ